MRTTILHLILQILTRRPREANTVTLGCTAWEMQHLDQNTEQLSSRLRGSPRPHLHLSQPVASPPPAGSPSGFLPFRPLRVFLTLPHPGWGRSPGEGKGNPLQYSCLGSPMDGGAQRAAYSLWGRVGVKHYWARTFSIILSVCHELFQSFVPLAVHGL